MQTITKVSSLVLISALPFVASAEQQTAGMKNEKVWNGTLTSVNTQNGTITTKKWFITKTFNTGHNCAIRAVDKKEAVLSDLCPGEKVKIRYQNVEGVLAADRIAEKALRCNGTVESIDPKASTLTMERGAIYKAFPLHKSLRLANDCKVILSNGKDGTLNDVKPGDMLTVIYELPGGSPVAYRIREHTATFVGSIDAIDLPARTVKAKEMFGEKKFDLADKCRIIVNGNENGSLKDLLLGQKYKFTYENVNGMNVVNRIAPAQKGKPAETASTK